ncbi:hypothetical protein SAMN05216474_0269 [Lishizhenia tianjinensis]|uniref:Uncharacterized protein n=1 Tax=Lishizhenia tianjinensis TaxID=477690 RepID=A0A1I6XK94_9FLAO|nr:ankyrin repeat domain-containing protein [Lishizhenia tianjinensis]SFT38720.1 hypothetical protein SAMN05216474_0269 [Lishizhenia tianjinensis]
MKIILILLLFIFNVNISFGQCESCDSSEFPIHCAIDNGNCSKTDIMRYIEQGYDVNGLHPQRKDTPLLRIAYLFRPEDTTLIDFMLNHGASPEITDAFGNNAIDKALQHRKYILVDLYIERGHYPVKRVDHPYYKAKMRLVPKGNKLTQTYKRYEKYFDWSPELFIPLSFTYSRAQQHNYYSIQSGLIFWNDDYYLAMSSLRLLAGPMFSSTNTVGLDVNLSFQYMLTDIGLSYKILPDQNRVSAIEPHIGISLGPIFSAGYSRRIYFTPNPTAKNFLYARLTLFHPYLSVKQRKKMEYVKAIYNN